MTLTAEKQIQVRFSEVDMMQVVWHGAYPAYLEDAREAFGKKYGLTYERYYKEHTFAPVVKLDINYKYPLRYGQKAVVQVTYQPTESAKMLFDYKIYSPEDGRVYVTANSVQVFMDLDYNLLWDNPPFYKEWKEQWFKEDK